MKRRWIFALMTGLIAALVTAGQTQGQQVGETVALTVRLRAADGAPVTGEPVALQRLPEEEPVLPECTTDNQGVCTWTVGRGLYQVLFDRPLDGVSALALAEGGLRGFGLTVGETPITYHFTFHTDGHVYFDSAPESARPAPIIPTPELLHGGIAPTAAPEATVTPKPAASPPEGSQRSDDDEAAEHPPAVESETMSGTEQRWRLALFIGLGLTVGSGLHLWSRRKEQRRNRTAARDKAAPSVKEDSDA
jgi:hypothetical protein